MKDIKRKLRDCPRCRRSLINGEVAYALGVCVGCGYISAAGERQLSRGQFGRLRRFMRRGVGI